MRFLNGGIRNQTMSCSTQKKLVKFCQGDDFKKDFLRTQRFKLSEHSKYNLNLMRGFDRKRVLKMNTILKCFALKNYNPCWS